MTDHTAHIEECEREREESWAAYMKSTFGSLEVAVTLSRHARAVEAHKRALLDAYGVPCPVGDCDDGHIATAILGATLSSPREITTEYCDYCEGRGMVLPAQADAYEGET